MPRSLNGIWLDEAAGEEVRIVQSGDAVEAKYLAPRACDHSNGTGRKSYTEFDFSGAVEGDQLVDAQIEVCRYGDASAGWTRTELKATIAADRASLSGQWLNQLDGSWIEIHFRRLRDAEPCAEYSAEIACDCDGDGGYETTRALAACGPEITFPPGSGVPPWPRSFQSKCEEWVRPDGSFGYAAYYLIDRQGVAYLDTLGAQCPSLQCLQAFEPCRQRANEDYEKCLFAWNFLGWRENCLSNANEAIRRCEEDRERCLAGIAHGPAPSP